MISLIAAHDLEFGIGYRNQIPWHISSDLKRFKMITTGHTVLMGRKTYESLGKALPGRINIVLTKQKNFKLPDALVINDYQEVATEYRQKELFVIGGEAIYRLFLPLAQKLYLSIVQAEFLADRFFPQFDSDDFAIIKEETHLTHPAHIFRILQRKESNLATF